MVESNERKEMKRTNGFLQMIVFMWGRSAPGSRTTVPDRFGNGSGLVWDRSLLFFKPGGSDVGAAAPPFPLATADTGGVFWGDRASPGNL